MTTSRAWATTARCCRADVGHDPGRDPVQPLAAFDGPDFGPQQPQAHLHEPVVQVDQHDVVPALGQGVVEDERPRLLPVYGCVQALGTLLPTAAEGRKSKDRARRPLRVGPEAVDLRRQSAVADRPVPGRPRRPSGRSPGSAAVPAWSRAACPSSALICLARSRSNLSIFRTGSASASARFVSSRDRAGPASPPRPARRSPGRPCPGLPGSSRPCGRPASGIPGRLRGRRPPCRPCRCSRSL